MEKYIPFITRKTSFRIPVDDVIYVFRKERQIQIVTVNGTYRYYDKMENVEKYLDKRFYHTLKCLIINFEYVERMEDQTIFFKNGECWIIGRANYIRTRQKFSAYIMNLL